MISCTAATITSTPLPSAHLPSTGLHAAYTALDPNIQALPQELQDQILDSTILAAIPEKRKPCEWVVKKGMYVEELHHIEVTARDDPEGAIWIQREDYKPPLGLQLNRKIREKFAKFYYTEFYFASTTHDVWDSGWPAWHRTLYTEHRSILKLGMEQRLSRNK